MARSLRIEFDGALYHVFSRGQRREAIFVEDRDRERFMELLAEMVEKHGIRLHAYVLMGNHYHLLMDTPRGNLSRAMKGLNTGYANWFKAKHRIVGSVLQGRYHAVLVDGDAYLAQVCAYIHLNPVRAGIVARPEDYPWGSHRHCLKPRSKPSWLTTEAVLGLFGGRPARYRRYVGQWIEAPRMTSREIYGRGGILGQGKFLDKLRRTMREKLEGKAPGEVRGVRRLQEVGMEAIRRILMGLGPKGERDLFGKRRGNVYRKLIVYGLKRCTGLSLKEIGEQLGMEYSAVAQTNARFNKELDVRPAEKSSRSATMWKWGNSAGEVEGVLTPGNRSFHE
jgi:REP element-mobilizing transposase RayT